MTRQVSSVAGRKCQQKFLRYFPRGFRDPTYIEWERGYKWAAHQQWEAQLEAAAFRFLLRAGRYREIADHAARIESRTNLLFSFEKMAFRDAVRSPGGARAFAEGLYDLLYGAGEPEKKFENWCAVLGALPRKQTRVLTWPLATVLGFLAQPDRHVFLKPMVTRAAAKNYQFDFKYESRPCWSTYASLLEFATTIRHDLRSLRPRDMVDVQSFIWVQGSSEYP